MATTATPVEVDLRELVSGVVKRAVSLGASAVEAVVAEGSEFSTVVRLGEVETLKESGSRALGVRVFVGQHAANTSTSDLSPEGVEQLVQGAIALAKITSEDPMGGIPSPEQLGQIEGDLGLYYDDVYSLSNEQRIDQARRAEKAALAVDPRLTNSEGGTFDASIGRKVLANSHGFVGGYRSSYCSISAVPIASDDEGNMQRDYWYSVARTLAKLESPEEVGRIAAERTLRRLGARKLKTQKVPIVFDRQTAGALLDHIFDAVNGDAIYRHSSFLAGKLGQKTFGSNLTVIDDGTIVGGFGTRPFDSEGVPTRRTTVIENGELKNYLLNTYTARKLGLATTGNASRGLAGTPGIGNGNFYLQPGEKSQQEIIKDVKQGLLVTEFLGFGVNLVTGDFSRGASGMWIENGALAYPVEEITVAGNLADMFSNLAEIGNDLIWRGSIACPTLRIEGMTIAGE
ncbi:MAG TPA: metallopeptidase TldD-related protein [Candidatus Saccharimonadales bacterium]|nr:metallopeptidase TldD-related protein [Candidatus Saccharimonadales bacterium]